MWIDVVDAYADIWNQMEFISIFGEHANTQIERMIYNPAPQNGKEVVE